MLTWTQRVAGALLYRHALAEGPPVERSWIRAGARALLQAATAAHVARRPVGPRRPAAVHCGGGEAGGMSGMSVTGGGAEVSLLLFSSDWVSGITDQLAGCHRTG